MSSSCNQTIQPERQRHHSHACGAPFAHAVLYATQGLHPSKLMTKGVAVLAVPPCLVQAYEPGPAFKHNSIGNTKQRAQHTKHQPPTQTGMLLLSKLQPGMQHQQHYHNTPLLSTLAMLQPEPASTFKSLVSNMLVTSPAEQAALLACSTNCLQTC